VKAPTRKKTATTDLSVKALLPRTERVSAKRRRLGELTMQLVRERGFDSLSVNELAEKASMSIGGLYRYIKTKNDLLEIVCDEINVDLSDRMAQATASTKGVSSKLKLAFRIYWDMCWDSAEPILVAYREWQSLSETARQRYISQEKRYAEFLSDLIRAGVASKEFRTVDEGLLASEMIMLAQMRAVKGWIFKGWKKDDIFAEHWALVLGRLRKSRSSRSE
jgi:TetR/AcrR family transcriptional regulator, cholesterol catabolism regulator